MASRYYWRDLHNCHPSRCHLPRGHRYCVANATSTGLLTQSYVERWLILCYNHIDTFNTGYHSGEAAEIIMQVMDEDETVSDHIELGKLGFDYADTIG